VDLDSVADELYGLRPAEFTAARDTRAADARKSGDRDLAAAIKLLKRPTSSAHLVNLLVRERGDQIDELLDLGDALREAQERLDADELRRLSQQRHQVVSGLVREVRKLASDAGLQMGGAIEREVQATLEAALADPAASDALRSGRLTGAMAYSGLGSVDLADVVALPARPAKARPARRPASPSASDSSAPATDAKERRQQTDAAKRVLQEAQAAAKDARRAVAELDRQVDRARKRHERVGHQISELKEQVAQLRAEETEAAREIREADRARESADRAANVAEAQATRAKDELDRVKG
jgi:hypothetical protein